MAICPLCDTQGENILWQDDLCRVILADEPDYPGFLRVILKAHIREMTDLPGPDQAAFMRVVLAAERALRTALAPDKINLASLGNVVPHLHWHVIPRFENDPHFPNPVWGARLRDTPRLAPTDLADQLSASLNRLLARAPGTE